MKYTQNSSETYEKNECKKLKKNQNRSGRLILHKQIIKILKAGLPATKKKAFSMRNLILGLILAFLGKNTALRAASTLIRVWEIRFSEQNFYFTSIYMLIRDRKNEGKFFFAY
jgi:hypothetical protein